MKLWHHIQTAMIVAETGTVSEAAKRLDYQRSTVIRHIDAIEKWFGLQLFIRHPKGYDLTQAGQHFANTTRDIDQKLLALRSELSFQADMVSGSLVISTLAPLSALLSEGIARFISRNPHCRVDIQLTERLEPLEKGAVQIAIRTGLKPDILDYVPIQLGHIAFGLYASPTYIKAHGLPTNSASLEGHHFICLPDHSPRIPFSSWAENNITPDNIVATSSDPHTIEKLVRQGIGIGFIPNYQNREGLINILPDDLSWKTGLWLVAHVDVLRTQKVQQFLHHIRHSNAIANIKA